MLHIYFAALFFAQATEPVGVPGWVPLVIAVILLLLFWWGLNRNSIPQGDVSQADDHAVAHPEEEIAQPSHVETAVADAVPETTRPKSVEFTETAAPAQPDDLKVVEGIGPKIEGILHAAGILTYAELASASVGQLEKIVREDAGIRVAFPDTWPEQAALASSGSWDELTHLQGMLKGGRRPQ